MPKDVKKFLLKAFILLIPAISLFCAYLIYDPFKVLRSYESYYISGVPNLVTLNREYVSTETFKTHYASNHYDSFIFGNSRSFFYEVNDWQKHIQSTRCFHYDASGESIYGIDAKFRYLDHFGAGISNALIVLDYLTLSVTNNRPGHLFRTPPALSGESELKYQFLFFRTYLDASFLVPYLHYMITGHFHEYMRNNAILDNRPMIYELYSNEIRSGGEALIDTNPVAFYASRTNIFYTRNTTESFSPQVIGPIQKQMLSDIQKFLIKHRSNYRIVINPLYDQMKIDSGDLKYLYEIFGRDNVYDFSGINKFTQSYTNYYETSHYRPHVAREIMNIIYTKTNGMSTTRVPTSQ